MTSFEEKVYQLLADRGLSVQELADQVDMPEPELRALCHRNDPRLSELERLARALRVPPSYFQHGTFNQAGDYNTQEIKIGKAAARKISQQLGVCRLVLEQSRQLVAAKDNLIASLEKTVASQDEILSLLRGGQNRPN